MDKNERKKLGSKIREKRKEKGMTYHQLADLCHVNSGYMRQLEGGQRMPSLSLLILLCQTLDISPNYLFEYTEGSEDKEILDRIYKLSPQEKLYVLHMLDAHLEYLQKSK